VRRVGKDNPMRRRIVTENLDPNRGVVDVRCGVCGWEQRGVSLVDPDIFEIPGENLISITCQGRGCGLCSSFPTFDPRNAEGYALGQVHMEKIINEEFGDLPEEKKVAALLRFGDRKTWYQEIMSLENTV